MNYKFRDFPRDFNSENNLFRDLLDSSLKNFQSLPNIDLYGSYPSTQLLKRSATRLISLLDKNSKKWLSLKQGYRTKLNKNNINVWVTFENKRVPVNKFDLTFSFDTDSYGNRNIYFPLIYTYIDFLENNAEYVKNKINQTQLTKKRNVTKENINKRKFACIFLNNPEPYRLRVINELSKIGGVDVFGSFSNDFVKDKIAKTKEYKFVIAMENDFYPGYVTEKPLEAWLGQSVPIYWGFDKMNIINKRAILNIADYKSLDEFIVKINNLNKNPNEIAKIINEPFLNKVISPKEIENKINRAISNYF
jgi:hypothetical protein